MRVNVNHKQNNVTSQISDFNAVEEKNDNDVKENLKDYFDNITERIKVLLFILFIFENYNLH